MPVINLDAAWFTANPDRRYRLRRQTAEEWRAWQVPPPADYVAWCIVERDTGAVTEFAFPTGEDVDDFDDALVQIVLDIGRDAA